MKQKIKNKYEKKKENATPNGKRARKHNIACPVHHAYCAKKTFFLEIYILGWVSPCIFAIKNSQNMC